MFLLKETYRITQYPGFSTDFKWPGQITGSSGSIMVNITEGFDIGGNREFSNFMTITTCSATKSQLQLYRALDQEYITESEFNQLYEKANEIIRKSGKLVQYLKFTNHRGIKLK